MGTIRLSRLPRAWIALPVLALSCTTVWRARFFPPERRVELPADAPFLKAHTRSGGVFVFSRWTTDEAKERIAGHGIAYDLDRRKVDTGDLSVPFTDVALVETNVPESVVRANLIVLAIVTGASLAVTAACFANPKACFGSCPTFYATDGERETLQAEGFSASIAHVFEATDVDALFAARPASRDFEVRMTNEALETHAVRSVRVLAARRPPGSLRVLRAGSAYWAANALEAPRACHAEAGDCREAVTALDDAEYHSPADGHDLSARETVDLVFPRVAGRAGLVVAGRNSLLNTFVLYQMLAYMGASAGEWFARIERGGPGGAEAYRRFGRVLGEVEVFARTRDGAWTRAGAFSEVGPIAREVQLVPLSGDLPDGDVHVRLVLARGNWKLDWLALAALGERVRPARIEPERVTRKGADDAAAFARLRDPDACLVTYPGDAYTLHFTLPEGTHELFLESRGYYYEWIREQWLPEEDPAALVTLLGDPSAAMRRLAPAYKRIEGDMEAVFWRSRIGR